MPKVSPANRPSAAPIVSAICVVHQCEILLSSQNPKLHSKILPIVEAETKNVLKPEASDFLLSPMSTEADKMPRDTKPKIIRSDTTVNAIPAPTQAKANPKPMIVKKASPGEKSSVPSYGSAVVDGVVSDRVVVVEIVVESLF